MGITYNSLVSAIENYLVRSDQSTISQIPTFIQNAQLKICREAKTIGLEKYVSGNFQTGVPVLAKPARWRRSISFSYGTGAGFNTRVFLKQRTYEYINQYWTNRTLTSPPIYYSDYDFNTLLIGPTPDQNYPFEYAYIELPVPIGPNVQTNWLTNYAGDVLLYGSLLEAIPFLKNDERIPAWEDKYKQGVASLTSQDQQSHFDRQYNREAD